MLNIYTDSGLLDVSSKIFEKKKIIVLAILKS